MAYLSEIKSKDNPTSASDYIEIVVLATENAEDFEVVLYRRNGNEISTTTVESGTLTATLPNGSKIYQLPIRLWEGGNQNGPAAIALVSEPNTVLQFNAVGTTNVTANGGPANGMIAIGQGNSTPGESHFWNPNGTYIGTGPSTPGAICFAHDTLIETKKGLRKVQDLLEGDQIQTRDNEYQPIRWIGCAKRSAIELAKHKNLRPIVIRKDAFGTNCPDRDLILSPQHRILSNIFANHLHFGTSETLVSAKHLANNTSIIADNICNVIYYHVMFDAHQIIKSNGVWTESFLPGDYSLSTLTDEARAEFDLLFTEFQNPTDLNTYTAARLILKKHEARVLCSAEY